MEALAPVDIERAAQRTNVATFIQNNLHPVAHIITEPDEEQEFEIRDYQLDALNSLWETREQGETTAMVVLATGLGKTSVGVADVVKFREDHRAKWGTDPFILFASNKDELGEQAAKRFAAFMPDASQGFYNGDKKVRDAELTFGTLQSLYRNLDTFEPDEYDYIIYDEAHHTKAETFEAVVNHFTPEFQLALTATPYRLDGKEIADLFGPAKYIKGLGEALAEGLLADIDYHIVFDDAVKAALEEGFHPETLRELRELLEVPQRNDSIADNIRQKMEEIGQENAKTIVFCNDKAHADTMAELLGGKSYHSGRDDRKEVLDEFRNGDLQIICVRDMFNEGIDIPDARLLVFLRGTESRTIFEQQIGRGLHGGEIVSVLDFVGNIKRLEDVVDLSNTISDLSAQYGLGDMLDANAKQRRSGGFKVTTNHTNFDFEKMVVDVLSTYQTLIFERAPEGYKSLNAFSKEIGVDAKRLKRLAAHYQIETGRHWFRNNVGTSLSPVAQEQVLGLEEVTMIPPEGYLSAGMFAKELGAHRNTLLKVIEENDIPLERHIYGTKGIRSISLSPEAQQMIRDLDIAEPVQWAPEGYVMVKGFAQELGITTQKLLSNIEEHGIPTGRYKISTAPGLCLSPEAQDQVRGLNLAVTEVPEDHISTMDYSKQTKTNHSIIMQRIRELGIEPDKYRVRGRVQFCLSPEEQELVTQTYYANSKLVTDKEDYMSLTAAAKQAGVSPKTFSKLLLEHGVEVEEVAMRGARTKEMLGPEAQAAARGLVRAIKAEPAPEGYISVNAFVKQEGIALTTLRSIIAEQNVEIGRHRFRTHTVASLSPEAQQQILAVRNKVWPAAPKGYLSVHGFAEELGVDWSVVDRLIDMYDIETGEHVFGRTKKGRSLSPEAQQQIRELRKNK